MRTSSESRRDREAHAGGLALKGLCIVMAFIGYEWFMSGLTKLVRGGFPTGLAEELAEKSEGTVGWYKSFLESAIIPNAKAFGILIEIGEVAIGVALIGGAIALLFRWHRLGYREEIVVWSAIAAGSLAAIFMNINFHLANGSAHPWLIPKDGFDEGVDMDSLLPLIEIVFAVIALKLIARLRADRASDHAAAPAGDAGGPV